MDTNTISTTDIPNKKHPITNHIFCIYARKNKHCYWNNYGRFSTFQQAVFSASRLLDNFRKENIPDKKPRNYVVKVVSIAETALAEKYDYTIPACLSYHTNWNINGFIQLVEMEENPDQTIYNGGN